MSRRMRHCGMEDRFLDIDEISELPVVFNAGLTHCELAAE